jgi:hypothetical protein
MDTTPLRDAYRALLDAAATVTTGRVPPAGEWNAEQIQAHVAILGAATIAAAASVASGANTTYDNRLSHDAWTIEHVISLAAGHAGLQERIRGQGDALCALVSGLAESELDRPVPTLLLSQDTLLVDQPMPLRDILTGLADVELPGHTRQLLALPPE